jgi:HemX protein
MHITDRQWLWLAAGFYLAGLVLGTVALVRGRRQSRVAIYGAIALGDLFQTWGLWLRGRATGGCPLGNLFELFQCTAWSATTLYLVVGTRFRLSVLGYFSACLAAVMTLLSLGVPAWDATRSARLFGGNPWVEVHAGLALFSYGVFGLLALTSLLYLLRDRSLKSKRLGGWCSFLPSLVELDHIGGRLLTTGVSLLGAALAVAWIYWGDEGAHVGYAKVLATTGVGLAYALMLGARKRGRLSGVRFARLSLVLFVLALATLWLVDRSRTAEVPAEKGGVEQR